MARADSVEPLMRSAHVSDHHARSSGSAKHHALADARTSVNPAAWAQATR